MPLSSDIYIVVKEEFCWLKLNGPFHMLLLSFPVLVHSLIFFTLIESQLGDRTTLVTGETKAK